MAHTADELDAGTRTADPPRGCCAGIRALGGFRWFAKPFAWRCTPTRASEYERRHQPIWPELEATLIEHGVDDLLNFRDPATNDLFAYVELESEQRWAALPGQTCAGDGGQYMRDLMPVNADGSPVAADLTEVFHIEAPGSR